MAMKRKGIATDRSEEFDRIQAENESIRARLERIYEEELVPEPDVQQSNYIDETIEERDRQLGELVFQMTKDINSFVKFQGYTMRQYHPDYMEIRVDGGARILEIKRENEQWNIDTNYPKHTAKNYTEAYINALVEHFEGCIREPHNLTENRKLRDEIETNRSNEIEQELLQDRQTGKSIQNLLSLYNETGRTFYPLRFEINKKRDKIKVFDRSQGNNNYKTIYEFYWIDNNWQKFLGNKRVIIPIDNLHTRVEELINKVDRVTDLKSFSYGELSDSQKARIMRHYAKDGDLQDSYRVRNDKPHYSIEGSKRMLEDGWDSETVKYIFNTPGKNSEVLEVIHIQKQVPLITSLDDVVTAIDLISPTFIHRVEEKVAEPEMSEPTPTIEKIGTIVVAEDQIVEEEQPIKVVEILQPPTIKRTRKQPDRDGR